MENLTQETAYSDISGADFGFICTGDGMKEAGINNGDFVYIHQQNTAENGEIVAVRVDGDVLLRRYFYDGYVTVLAAGNSAVWPLIFLEEEAKDFEIEGVAVGVYHRL